MLNVHNAMTAIGLGLLVLFFAAGIVKTCGSFAEARRPEHALKLFIRFVLAKGAVQYGLELMLAVFDIVQGIVSRAMGAAGTGGLAPTTLPPEIVDKINAVGFWSSIPLWAVTLLGGLFITVLSFVMIMTVYGRKHLASPHARMNSLRCWLTRSTTRSGWNCWVDMSAAADKSLIRIQIGQEPESLHGRCRRALRLLQISGTGRTPSRGN